MTTDQRISENTVGKAQLEHNALYIGGRWRAARSRPRFLAVNPETEQPLGSFPDASSEDDDEAVNAARTSFDDGICQEVHWLRHLPTPTVEQWSWRKDRS
jgi:hypothetical protein